MDPLRTCVGCRERATQDALLRVVVREGQLLVDEREVLPGRGAWVHPATKCLKQAVSRGSFARALKVSGSLDTSPLENRLETHMDN